MAGVSGRQTGRNSGRAWLAQGDARRAREALWQARAVAEENKERVILWQILATLGDVEEVCGNAAEAGEWRCQARKVIDYIVEFAGSDEMRASFLSQPAVTQAICIPDF